MIDELVDRIVGGSFAEGATLPTEPALGEAFGVSRSVLREAIKALESMRLVKVQQGQGTTVLPLDRWDLVNPVVLAAVIRHDEELEILDNLVDVRRSLEAEMARAAAQRVTPADVARMDERYALMESFLDDQDRYAEADVAFHDAILEASGNPLGRAIIGSLTVEAYRSLRYVGEPTTADRAASNVAHKAIRDAVAAGDPDLAGTLMEEHIREAWERRRPARKRQQRKR